MDYLKLIQDLETRIRNGQISSALDAITKLNFERIPRRHRQKLANLAWRSGGVQQGFHILHPVVRSEEALARGDATESEIIEYSMLLQKMGSTREAFERLDSINSDKNPQVLLYKVFCEFSQWRYRESIDLLNEYLRHDLLTEYNVVVGKTNLLSAYLCVGRYDMARTLSEELLRKLRDSDHQRLYGNILEMRAQIEIYEQNFKIARKLLGDSIKVLSKESGSYQLFAKKWLAILESLESSRVESIEKFRNEASKKQHWESLREADLFQLKINHDEDVFKKLLYGTPYIEYQERILQTLGKGHLGSYSDEVLIRAKSGEKQEIDFIRGKYNGEQLLKPGKAIHKLLAVLSYDLYKPTRIGSLFSSIYADEHFDIMSSPNRIHQLVNRAKKLIKENSMGIELIESGGAYSIGFNKNVSFRVQLQKLVPETEFLYLKALLEDSSQTSFKTSEIMNKLDLPLTSANRFVKWALDSGYLVKSGTGKKTIYFVSDKLEKRVA